ncbi:hypothetical protein ACFWN7_12015 [Agromyces sp. NPDC058484]|uniref:hypothetical protein n=1 Tax=Agromyces sp. NPDC058484 TaxID=3346524 RepID=UPI003652D31B
MPLLSSFASRRAVLRLGVAAAWSLGALTVTPRLGATAAPQPWLTASGPGGAEPPRYRFDCITPVPGFAPLHRLEEVWASPRYMTFTDCVVGYFGEEPFHLTAQESAIVRVAEEAGATVDDREGLYLLILATSSRIDPARFDEKLAELGRPVVTASLALAPEAPQAAGFAAWLEA